MLLYTRFIVLESSHAAAQIDAFLREKGFDVTLIESADMLPVAADESWKEITVVVDVDKAGKEGLSVIEKNGRFVVLTSRPSRVTSLFSIASRF